MTHKETLYPHELLHAKLMEQCTNETGGFWLNALYVSFIVMALSFCIGFIDLAYYYAYYAKLSYPPLYMEEMCVALQIAIILTFVLSQIVFINWTIGCTKRYKMVEL